MIYIFLADGFEEIEALAPTDILRRAGREVLTVGVTGKTVSGAHGIPVTADITVDEVVLDDSLEAVVLPGGMPGTTNLEASDKVKESVMFAVANEKLIGAICAAPSVFGHWGLLEGRKATCFPGFEKDLHGAMYSGEGVVKDGVIITAKGAGVALQFGEALAAHFTGAAEANRILRDMQSNY